MRGTRRPQTSYSSRALRPGLHKRIRGDHRQGHESATAPSPGKHRTSDCPTPHAPIFRWNRSPGPQRAHSPPHHPPRGCRKAAPRGRSSRVKRPAGARSGNGAGTTRKPPCGDTWLCQVMIAIKEIAKAPTCTAKEKRSRLITDRSDRP